MKQRLFTLAFLILGKNQNWLILLFIKPSLFVYAVKRSSFSPLPSLSFLFPFPLFPSLFLRTPFPSLVFSFYCMYPNLASSAPVPFYFPSYPSFAFSLSSFLLLFSISFLPFAPSLGKGINCG